MSRKVELEAPRGYRGSVDAWYAQSAVITSILGEDEVRDVDVSVVRGTLVIELDGCRVGRFPPPWKVVTE